MTSVAIFAAAATFSRKEGAATGRPAFAVHAEDRGEARLTPNHATCWNERHLDRWQDIPRKPAPALLPSEPDHH